MARACIFCGSRENLNREDLWPKWLVETVTQDRPSEIERIFGSDSTAHFYGGKWVKGRGVCEQCNGGWMSNLESKIKLILEPMIFDSSSVLDYVQQSAIAIWTLKTAMAFECIKGAASTPATANEVFYSAADRQHLQSAFNHVSVRLGCGYKFRYRRGGREYPGIGVRGSESQTPRTEKTKGTPGTHGENFGLRTYNPPTIPEWRCGRQRVRPC